MTQKTSYEELYSTIGAILKAATGRSWWQKSGLQSRPTAPYALIYIAEGESHSIPVVENIELTTIGDDGETIKQTPWNTIYLDIRAEFYSSRTNNSALQAANRFRSALYLEERRFDVWDIFALSGPARVIDISGVFAETIEDRAEVRFSGYANIADPLPLTGYQIYDINSQEVNVTEVLIDGTEDEETITIVDDTEESS